MSVIDSRRDAWIAMRAKNRQDEPEPELPLQFGGRGGTFGPMEPSVPLKEYVDKADEAVESRLMARLDNLATSKEVRESQASIRANVWGAVVATVGIILAVLAFAGDRFDAGIGQADTRQAQLERDRQQDAKYDEILNRLPPAKSAPFRP